MKARPVIGITDCSKYLNYERWIFLEPDVEVIRLGYKADNLADIKKCDGILLTGGEDVHPRFYNRPDLLPLCHQEDMDPNRDEFELKTLDYATKNNIPILGICRGLQIANVFLGGTLIPDIPTTGKPDHAKVNGIDRYHAIQVSEGTLLKRISALTEGEVNSAHHQSADLLGRGLKVNSVSQEGIVEGLELEDSAGKPFFLLVQWHPERMMPAESPFAKNVKDYFIKSIR